AVPIQADSADEKQVSAAVDEAVSHLGGLDILVNNAGVTRSGTVEDFPMDEFDRMLAINVRAVFVAIQQAIPHLGTDGRIITTGSIFADHAPRPGSAVYAMTNAAVAVDAGTGPRAGTARNNRQCHPARSNGDGHESGLRRIRRCHAETHRSRSLRAPSGY